MKNLFLVIALLCSALAFAKAQKGTALTPGHHYQATIQTSEGNFTVKLHNETPIHRDNFVKLARSEFYKGILFHRVIKNFMVQAGDPSSKEGSEVRTYGNDDSGYKLDAEIVPQFFHKKGALAAARENDDVNPTKQSSGSQFYVVVGDVLSDSTMEDMKEKIKFRKSLEMTPEREKVYRTIGGTPHLDGNYTIFGQVINGQKVIDAINDEPTYKNDRPKKDIYIKKIIVKIVADKR